MHQNELFKDIEPSSYQDDGSIDYRPQQNQKQQARSQRLDNSADIRDTRVRNIKK